MAYESTISSFRCYRNLFFDIALCGYLLLSVIWLLYTMPYLVGNDAAIISLNWFKTVFENTDPKYIFKTVNITTPTSYICILSVSVEHIEHKYFYIEHLYYLGISLTARTFIFLNCMFILSRYLLNIMNMDFMTYICMLRIYASMFKCVLLLHPIMDPIALFCGIYSGFRLIAKVLPYTPKR